MRFSQIIIGALAGLTSAAPSVLKRDMSTVAADFATINADLTSASTLTSSFSGSAVVALEITNYLTAAGNEMDSTWPDVSALVAGVASISVADSDTLHSYLETTVGLADGILNALIAKKTAVELSGGLLELLFAVDGVKENLDSVFLAAEDVSDLSTFDENSALKTIFDNTVTSFQDAF